MACCLPTCAQGSSVSCCGECGVRRPARNARHTYDTERQAPARKKQTRRDRRYNYRRQDDGAWHIAPLCQILVCGIHVPDGYEVLHDVFKENANKEARNARCPHVHRRATWWCRLRHTGYLGSITQFSTRNLEDAHSLVDRKNRHETVQNHTKDTRGGRGHVHPCCRQDVQKLQKAQLLNFKRNKNAQLRSSAPSTPAWLSICAVSPKLLAQPSPLLSSDRSEALPSERLKKRQLEKKNLSCERHTSLAVANVVAQQLDGVALRAVHLIAKVSLPVEW